MSRTGAATPDAVDRIGLSLAAQLHGMPETAFDADPETRVGAILNSSTSVIRDDMLTGLEEADQDFAARVRKAIFTFAHIPDRVIGTDVPKLTRDVDPENLRVALSAALAAGDPLAPAAEFILTNMSKRMSAALREEIEEAGKVKTKDGEIAMTQVINTIRRLEADAVIALLNPDDTEDG